ncbi:gamma-glutamyltransferase [Streptomyces lunaelactis]|uniref:gamma-glutamyltransferase n=1 Tax=Streptomyces lunaelactis TaxID=1535768 RepID=UPI001585A54C|nr:gamma-glutamyltransferase [Streptomyces lunaelactis]NUK10901.1 gamma-glutamyltransferase [Streptomyces lunaelactis]NUK60389.1 gamma-glutamyltransferase [Streptomyces lunaelactis]NUK74063.1 gamma-glutamyltransferase [Streptomyces lunaelactis]NUK80440.1 gamma-glutamyltransferase [Streptomyces lunaelactis]NUL12794.1 gamma-glutamyltransferase [Streptomyces lunaelactis]
MRRSAARNVLVFAVAAAVVSIGAAAPPSHSPPVGTPANTPVKSPVAAGYGGAIASVDPDASAAGIEVLRRGGNAVDAAVATAAALGVTEPYSAGIGGGGYFVYYDARSRKVHTIDGRETAPGSADASLFVENGKPIPFEEGMTSGLGVGTPGTPATWDTALDAWGTRPLRQLLKPAERLAKDGFTVDATFRSQTEANQARFADFPDTAELFLPGGQLPVVGSVFKNPDLARTYKELGSKGVGTLYRGELARDIVRTVRKPPVAAGATRVVRPGDLTTNDLRSYETEWRAPTKAGYRGLDVYGMAPSSSGGTSVGEALNILERTDLSKATQAQYLHRFIEASRIAFADRGRWVGDPDFEDVPTKGLLSQRFADSRECLIKDNAVLTSPLAPGDPGHPAACSASGTAAPTTYEGENTTHLTAADKWGNVVAYTLTIESTGGSGITVPGRGFLLNNELTDFSFAPANPAVHDPNLPGPGKRPRSSMSPTIVLDHGRPVLAMGSPGGATIITTVLRTLTGHLDRGLPLVDAIAAPRASQRNQATTELEPALWNSPLRAELEAIGHAFRQNPEIGAATGIQRLPDGRWLAAAEKVRRGGGSAMVVHPSGNPSGG